MRTKELQNGFKLPAIGIGTYGLGGNREPDYAHDKENISAIKKAIKVGFRHIDTAERYGRGHSEELLGKAIKEFDRTKLIITTKVHGKNLKYEDVINSAKNSLKRLKIGYIDLYLIHHYNPEIPLKETMASMDFLIEQGLVKNIGVSNFNIEQIKEAQKYTKNKIVANEINYSPWSERVRFSTIEYCQNNDILIIAHKPFGRGKINTEKIKILAKLSKKYGKTEAQITLNWLISKKNIVTIFKSVNHLRENYEATDFQLTNKDCEKIDENLNELIKVR
ncbi:MAG: aldo/keto reductase [archaeon]